MKLAWIDFHKVQSSVYTEDGDQVDITEEYAESMVRNFYACKDKGYAVPLIRNHGREDSWIYGDVVEVRVSEGMLQAGVMFTDETAKEAFNDGRMREFSPGFSTDWTDPHTGEKMGPTLLELSFTGLGYQRNLRAPQQANPVQLSHKLMFNFSMETVMSEETKDEVSIEERMTRLEAKLDEVMSKFASEPDEEMMADGEEEEEMQDDEKEEMSRRIQHLEDQLVKTQIVNAGVKDDVEGLVKLARIDAKLFASTLKKLARTSQTEIGVMGVADTNVSLTAIDAEYVAKAAKKSGADAPGKLTLFLSKNHPSFVERTQEVRAAIRKL